MRDYLSIGNLWKALILGAAMTVMSIPRILQGGMPLGLYLPAAFLSMTLVSGAATAWGDQGGLCGLFPGPHRTWVGLGLAVSLAAVITPVYSLWLDPVLYAAMEATGDAKMLALRYPDTVAGKLSLMLWSGSFQTMFFAAAGMSFTTRLTGRPWLSGALVVLFRIGVGVHQLSEAGVTNSVPLFLLGSAVAIACSCALFARTGLVPVMAFAMGLNLHLFF